MGIVEHFKLAVIAGLPDGATIARTGMKVFKHDDSQQHGVGILPTVLVTRTRQNIAEGKDEVLLRAVEVLKR